MQCCSYCTLEILVCCRSSVEIHSSPSLNFIYSSMASLPQMYNSIRQIRSSATRKKVDKIFEKLDSGYNKQKHSTPTEASSADSGIGSKLSSTSTEQESSAYDTPKSSNSAASGKKG